jgi:hypothetical protein
MKKVFILFVLFFAFLHNQPAFAQSKKNAEKEFLQQLNTVLKKSLRHESGYEGKMLIDTPFAINREGLLCVTLRYTNDSTYQRVRLEAPVKDIRTVRYDLYLILEYGDDLVTKYESEWGSAALKEVSRGSWFHVGAPLPEDVTYQQKVQQALDKLKKFKSIE